MISDTNVTSYSLHPGVVFSFNTRILRSFVYGGELVERLIAALLWPFTKSEVAGAQTSIHLATEERHKLRSGGYYECVLHDTKSTSKLRIMSLVFRIQGVCRERPEVSS